VKDAIRLLGETYPKVLLEADRVSREGVAQYGEG